MGLEGIGIRLKLEDCRIIFETLDYDNAGEIDFSKFCLLNTDRKINWAELVSFLTINCLNRKNIKIKAKNHNKAGNLLFHQKQAKCLQHPNLRKVIHFLVLGLSQKIKI